TLAGVDEAGRGPLAGPVAAAAVSMDPQCARRLRGGELSFLTDSKRLGAEERALAAEVLKGSPGVRLAVAFATAAEIDRLNILRATHLAMRRALLALPGGVPDEALVDGLPVTGLPCTHVAVVKGDAKSFLVAAASVIAKTARDAEMDALDSRFPGYGFAVHKGYPTPAHLEALRRLGPCPEHRRSFGPVRDVLNPPML
ncbi:MAG: ribonuclease HII, partial [Kiritimatiellae bacterium]|nr:ribonuclease HII [Kiritimatiellia bacterium]